LWRAAAIDQLRVTNDGFLAGLLGEAHEVSVVAVGCGALTAETAKAPRFTPRGSYPDLSLQEKF
jgi:hypothetical protein